MNKTIQVTTHNINDGVFEAVVVGADGVERTESPRIPLPGETHPRFDLDETETLKFVRRTHVLGAGDLVEVPYQQAGQAPS